MSLYWWPDLVVLNLIRHVFYAYRFQYAAFCKHLDRCFEKRIFRHGNIGDSHLPGETFRPAKDRSVDRKILNGFSINFDLGSLRKLLYNICDMISVLLNFMRMLNPRVISIHPWNLSPDLTRDYTVCNISYVTLVLLVWTIRAVLTCGTNMEQKMTQKWNWRGQIGPLKWRRANKLL